MSTLVVAYINPHTDYAAALEHTIRLIAINQHWRLKIVDNLSKGVDLSLDYSDSHSWDFLKTDVARTLIDKRIETTRGNQNISSAQIELLPIIFYLVNSCQEMAADKADLDRFGRFKYSSSWQYRSGTITHNIVQDMIHQFVLSLGMEINNKRTQIFVTHDIDFLYGSKSEDLSWAAKHWKIGAILKIIFNEISKKPHWRNIDRVLQINSEYEIRATFFWLVNQGRSFNGILNADYDIKAQGDLIKLIENNGSQTGLHKSDSPMTIDQEIEHADYKWNINRYHFLKFNVDRDWSSISNSKINLDCSHGFADHYGFRNSYGTPFTPFDIVNNRPFDFVEAPLHVMDATFLHYLKTDPNQIGKKVIDFIEMNRRDCVISILWHNNYLSDFAYKPFLIAYKNILRYIYDNQFECITPYQVIEQFSVKRDDYKMKKGDVLPFT